MSVFTYPKYVNNEWVPRLVYAFLFGIKYRSILDNVACHENRYLKFLVALCITLEDAMWCCSDFKYLESPHNGFSELRIPFKFSVTYQHATLGHSNIYIFTGITYCFIYKGKRMLHVHLIFCTICGTTFYPMYWDVHNL